jgi:hypothetical protein
MARVIVVTCIEADVPSGIIQNGNIVLFRDSLKYAFDLIYVGKLISK